MQRTPRHRELRGCWTQPGTPCRQEGRDAGVACTQVVGVSKTVQGRHDMLFVQGEQRCPGAEAVS